MITLRPSNQRGGGDHGWLKTQHTFSFGDYYDPDHMSFRSLRVINEDHVAPGQGFGMHPHKNMEIVTYIVKGALEHRDSLGNGEALHPGEIQRMSAGTGILHSEFNPSKTEPVHLLQIWIMPEKNGLAPSYEQKAIPVDERRGRLRTLVSPGGEDGAVKIHQDARLYATLLKPGQSVTHTLAEGRHAWVQLVKGGLDVNGVTLAPGDGAAVSDEPSITLKASADSEALVFDLA